MVVHGILNDRRWVRFPYGAMKNIYFTSDTHFDHKNILKFCDRPYGTVEEMNEKLIENWNSVVSPNDTIYHLGDFAFSKDPKQYWDRLKGKKIILKGNHDRHNKNQLPFLEDSILELKIEKHISITLCHYPMYSWNGSYHNNLHLYGHVHDSLFIGSYNSLNVGCDNNNYTPISYEEVREKIDKHNLYIDNNGFKKI